MPIELKPSIVKKFSFLNGDKPKQQTKTPTIRLCNKAGIDIEARQINGRMIIILR